MSAIAFLVLTMSFACFDQVVMFPMERKIMLRENAGGAYKISAFYVGRTLAEFPVQLAFSCLVGIITWAMFGLQQSTLGPYVLLIVLATLTGAALLTLVGSLSDSLAMGNALASVVLVFASLFNGFFISSDNLVPFWRWIQAISFPAFAVRGAISVELDDLTYSCSPDEIAAGCTGTGSSILAAVGAQNISWRLMCLYLLIEMIVFRILTFLALHFLWTELQGAFEGLLLLKGARTA
jgi:ABC-type multidrug transport system permease subunit